MREYNNSAKHKFWWIIKYIVLETMEMLEKLWKKNATILTQN